MNTQQEDFYKNLQQKLEESNNWPSDYLYKFIVPTEEHKIKRIQNIFEHTNAVIHTRSSKNGKFTSVSVRIKMNSAADVITKYKEAGKIEGIISL